ncbi:hypothetical protein [Streptomyces botrytidirepellens]|uniref:hypothetical protein n=1 Tax=Streptomyces botrytidirepellens TaxID=2486417 RepID=UPI001FE5960F|nr:hypothetical protein [Streptomyces botrytidirepellens]
MILGLGISATCALGALIALLGVIAMAFPGRPEPWPEHLMRRAAGLAAFAAASIYSLGLFGVLASEHETDNGANSSPAPACRDGFAADTVRHLSHHRSSYLPLRFDCVRDDGTTYPSEPAYVWMNWTTLFLLLSCAVLIVGAGYASEFRARKGAGPRRADCTY